MRSVYIVMTIFAYIHAFAYLYRFYFKMDAFEILWNALKIEMDFSI